MLREREMQVLEIIGRNLLIRKEELKSTLRERGFEDGISIANRLSQLGYLKFIEAVGSPCYTITQEGLRALKSG
jgi:arginine repressor